MPISDFDFGAEEPGRVNLRLELAGVAFASAGGVGIALEQRRRDHVHALVGRLRRQDRRHQQLERVPVVQLGVRVRMLRLELVEDRAACRRTSSRPAVAQ